MGVSVINDLGCSPQVVEYSADYYVTADGRHAVSAKNFGIKEREGWEIAAVVSAYSGHTSVNIRGVMPKTSGTVMRVYSKQSPGYSGDLTAKLKLLWVRKSTTTVK